MCKRDTIDRAPPRPGKRVYDARFEADCHLSDVRAAQASPEEDPQRRPAA